MPSKYARFGRTETKRSGIEVSPTSTIPVQPSDSERGDAPELDVRFTELELDLSGRPREMVVGVPKDVVLVDWDGEDDPENPLNW